ncbi:hypothetical protein BDR26DRAFT_69858 [Obelidium mucronatum]|nr:hypothetical protein BDR26DRAFT_69858 [Obelidium mucronatum]
MGKRPPSPDNSRSLLLPVLRSAYEVVEDAVLVALPFTPKTATGSMKVDARILFANSAALKLLGFNSSNAVLQRAFEGVSLCSILFDSPSPATAACRLPIDISLIVSKFEDLNVNRKHSSDDSIQTIKLKLNAKSVSEPESVFQVDATISQLSRDALVARVDDVGEEIACPLVLTLKQATGDTLHQQTANASSENSINSKNLNVNNAHLVYSRYKNEFEELSCLGKGGFGIVYRARNRLDGIEYAIKKVKLSCTLNQFSLFASASDGNALSYAAGSLASSSVPTSQPNSISVSDARLLNEIKLFARFCFSHYMHSPVYKLLNLQKQTITASKCCKLPYRLDRT